MTQPLEISILSAPLEAIDPRAISQAWYSALGLAGKAKSNQNASAAGSRALQSEKLQLFWTSQDENFKTSFFQKSGVARARQNGERTAVRRWSALAPTARRRRHAPSVLANRIVRKLTALPKRATVAIGEGAGRVQLMLQKSDGRMRIVAICPKRMQARVAMALDEARYALATRGVSAHSYVKGKESCK